MAARGDFGKQIIANGYSMLMTKSDIGRCLGWNPHRVSEFVADLPVIGTKEYFYMDVVDKLLNRRIVDSSKDLRLRGKQK